MKLIPLTQGHSAIVDDIQFDRLSKYKWRLIRDGNRFYAYRDELGCLIGLHQDVLGKRRGLLIDHIDGDCLNNLASNLRYATQSQNQANSAPRANSSCEYKGVTRLPARVVPERWIARLKIDGKNLYLGTFTSKEEAASAYDKAARQHFREYARCNFPA